MSLARSVFRHLKWLLTFFQPATVSSCLSISTILEVFTGNALLLVLGRPSITGRHGLLSVASPRRLPIDFKRERERERESELRWLSRGRGNGCQLAKMQKKSGCVRGLSLLRRGLAAPVGRVSPRGFPPGDSP